MTAFFATVFTFFDFLPVCYFILRFSPVASRSLVFSVRNRHVSMKMCVAARVFNSSLFTVHCSPQLGTNDRIIAIIRATSAYSFDFSTIMRPTSYKWINLCKPQNLKSRKFTENRLPVVGIFNCCCSARCPGFSQHVTQNSNHTSYMDGKLFGFVVNLQFEMLREMTKISCSTVAKIYKMNT